MAWCAGGALASGEALGAISMVADADAAIVGVDAVGADAVAIVSTCTTSGR